MGTERRRDARSHRATSQLETGFPVCHCDSFSFWPSAAAPPPAADLLSSARGGARRPLPRDEQECRSQTGRVGGHPHPQCGRTSGGQKVQDGGRKRCKLKWKNLRRWHFLSKTVVHWNHFNRSRWIICYPIQAFSHYHVLKMSY